MPNLYLPPVIQIPSSLLITAITNSLAMVVTVEIGNESTEANTYIAGMAIKLFVPISYKMFQANGLVGNILSINGNDFTLDINSSTFDVFQIPTGLSVNPASISPAGSRNYQYTNNSGPVAFHSLNNIGN